MEGTWETGRRHRTGRRLAVTWAILAGAALAVPVFVQGQELSSSNREAVKRYNQGLDRLRTADWAGAAAEFTAASDLDPKFAEAYMRLGQARANMGFVTEAVTCFEKALALKADLTEARVRLTDALLVSKSYDRAESEANRVLQQDRERRGHEAYFLLGQIAMFRAREIKDVRQRFAMYDKAAEHFSRGVELRGGDAEYRYHFGIALLSAGRLPEAAEQLREAARINSNNSLYHRQLGEVYFVLERHAEASAHLILAQRDEKHRDKELYLLLAQSAQYLGLYREAAFWAALAQKEAPNDAQVLLISGIIHRYLRNHSLADQFIRQALLADRKLPGADYQLGMLYFDRGEWRAAIEYLRKATNIVPGDYQAWYQLGLTYRCMGQTAESDRPLARFKELKDAEQAAKERVGIEAGPADRLVITTQPATQPAAP